MFRTRALLAFVCAALWCSVAAAAEPPPDKDKMVAMLKFIDFTMTVPSDYKLVWYLHQTYSDGTEKTWQSVVYRRDEEESLLVMAEKPRTEAGKGFLRVAHNLWAYDPSTGKWERRGEDRSLIAKSSRRRDFDVWRVADEYDPSYVEYGKLGDLDVVRLKLTLKKSITWETDFPTWDIWLDVKTGLPAKIEQYAESGTLMRTLFYPKWLRKKHPKTGKEIVVSQEYRVFDQIDKGTRMQVVLRDVSFDDLEKNVFTKAWVEAKSR